MTNLENYISSEREFLHSISTPLMISMSYLELILEKQEKMSAEDLTEKMNKAKTALQKVSQAVHERRQTIKSLVSG